MSVKALHLSIFFSISISITSLAYANDILFVETFDYPDGDLPEMFWSEGCEALIKEGKLFIDADTSAYRASTIWLDKIFTEDISVEFDVRVVSSKYKANNINFFLMYSDPSGENLRTTSKMRESGQYSYYHKLNGYIFTNVTIPSQGNNLKTRYRFRDNPGFEIIDETFTYGEIRDNVTFQIKILKVGNNFQFWIDGEKIIDAVDDNFNPVHNSGLIAFRTWRTALWIDNLVVKRIENKIESKSFGIG